MLAFDNITTLAVTQSPNFLGAGFHYSTNKQIQIDGLVLDLKNSWGITGIWTGIKNIANNASDYEALVINGKNFGSGRIVSLNFSPGVDVRTKEYSATINVLESGHLSNLVGTYYNNIDLDNFRYLSEFSENYSFNRKTNGGYAYNHNANVRFSSGVGSLNAIQTAQDLARTLFTGANLGINFYSGFTNKQGKRYFGETYNLIDNSCSFQETFDFDSNSGNYSVIRTNLYSLNADGIVSVSENADIRGIENPNFEKARAALASEMADAYARCNGIFSLYAPVSAAPLITTPNVQGISYDVFNNNLSYSTNFNNDRSASGSYFWSYSQQIARDNGVAKFSEDGAIVGRGNNKTVAFENARAGFDVVKAGVNGRIATFYTSNGGASPYFLESQSRSFSPFRGEASYQYSYSDEPFVAGTNGIKRIFIKEQNGYPLGRMNKYFILNYKEIVQNSKGGSEGNKSVGLVLVGENGVALSTYLDNAKTQFNSLVPAGTDVRIVNAEYAFSPNQKTVEASAVWSYNTAVTPTSSLL